MAILNGLYIHVVDEDLDEDVDTTSHPVEKGLPTTDTVRVKPVSVSLSGKIVDYDTTKAEDVIKKIRKLMKDGSLVTYKGRNTVSNLQIQAFSSSYPNTNSGGADFSMELREVRIAKSSYVPQPVTQAQKTETKKAPATIKEIKVGDKVVFKGGSVYVSSDAKKAAATRSRSTCKVTIINTKSWATHQYHLISTDGKKVYGWVDKANIEGMETTSTSGTTNGGTKQVTTTTAKKTTSTKKAVYHTVKKGDTIWGLVNINYKDLNTSIEWVAKNNPNAFSKSGNATSLKVGAKLLMGYRK